MSQRVVDIPLHDIKPLVDVPDTTFIVFSALVIIGIVVSVSLLWFLLKKTRNRRQSERKRFYAQLSSIDFSDPKKAAYRISEIGYRFVEENERTAKAYQNLFERLEPYKYAPNVKAIDEETIGYYRIYLEIIDG